MPPVKVHERQLDIAAALVRRLLVAQFPAWAPLPLVPVASTGTVNAIDRLGDETNPLFVEDAKRTLTEALADL